MKKVLKILTLLMLIFTIIKIGDTYSKYIATVHTDTLSQEVGKWEIKINEMDIYSEGGETVEFEVNEFNSLTDKNVEQGKIAPGSEGYIDIQIDPAGTDVAVRYDIELDLTGTSDSAIQGRLQMMTENQSLIQTGENTYSGIISLSDVQVGKIVSVRCFLAWPNDEENNEEDTAVGSTLEGTVSLKTNITVTQYVGEELIEYVEPQQTT